MKQIIRLKDIYSADLYTRSRASELRSTINNNADEVVLDFEQIGFMSRSFADEICNIIDDMKTVHFSFENRNGGRARRAACGARRGRSRGQYSTRRR